MTKVLVLRSAATGAASVSNRLIDTYLDALRAKGDITVTDRNLDTDPVPHVTSQTLAGIGRPAPETEAAKPTRELADKLIGELFDNDLFVIGLPMYNFGIPSTLKAWFDHVLRAGTTFQYSAQGPEGLVKGKKAIVVQARAGVYEDNNPAAVALPHLKVLLGFMGVTDVEVVTAEGLAFGEDAAKAAIAGAGEKLAALAA
ncbi:MAG TPA: NAD(P)H-dependent oxidoreductase [Novosphingobium sp.]|nr:NAD(P)H-dependent oxidoreductase [Novosphingobium sp.]